MKSGSHRSAYAKKSERNGKPRRKSAGECREDHWKSGWKNSGGHRSPTAAAGRTTRSRPQVERKAGSQKQIAIAAPAEEGTEKGRLRDLTVENEHRLTDL